MTKINKTVLKSMKVEEIQKLMQDAGVAYSTDVKKDELIKLALVQKEQIEEFLALQNYDEEVNEMNKNEEVNNVVGEEVKSTVEITINEEDLQEFPQSVIDKTNAQLEEIEMHKQINAAIDACETLEEVEDIANSHSVMIEWNEYNSLAIFKHDLKKELGTDYLVEDNVELKIGDNVTHVGQEVADRVKEIKQQVSSKRGGRGKKIIITKNGEYFGEEPTIKACAARFKELFELKGMPFNPIMKSTRSEGQEPWKVGDDTYVFIFENKDDILTPRQKLQTVKEEEISEKFEEINEQEQFIEAIGEELIETTADEVVDTIEEVQ